MKTTSTLALSALFSTLVTALPSANRHAHHAQLHKKALVVVTEEVIETVYSTTTIWVDGTATPTSVAVAETPASVSGLFYEHPSSKKAATPSSVYTPPASSSVYTPPASVYTAPVVSSSVYTPPASSSVYTPPPASSSVYTPPPASSSVYTPPVVSSVYTPPAVSSAVVETTPAYVAPSSTAAAATPSASSGGSPSGTTYTGDITYYNPAGGYGACGFLIQDSDHVVAIAHDTWDSKGTMSNGNPWCGQMITIKNKLTGIEYPAKVGDKCMGTDALPCTGGNIDLAQGFFDEAFPSVNGRGHSDVFEWWVSS